MTEGYVGSATLARVEALIDEWAFKYRLKVPSDAVTELAKCAIVATFRSDNDQRLESVESSRWIIVEPGVDVFACSQAG